MISWLRRLFRDPSPIASIGAIYQAGPKAEPEPSYPSGFSSAGIQWRESFNPPLACRIEYADRHGEYSERDVYIAKAGVGPSGAEYVGVFEDGKFKTLRRDRILKGEPTGSPKQEGSRPAHTKCPLNVRLPDWHQAPATYKIPSFTGNRRWTVDLVTYECTCPERRIRLMQYEERTVGMVCGHMAQAIRTYLPPESSWPEVIRDYINLKDAGSMAHTI